jgi:hypothetical protein
LVHRHFHRIIHIIMQKALCKLGRRYPHPAFWRVPPELLFLDFYFSIQHCKLKLYRILENYI